MSHTWDMEAFLANPDLPLPSDVTTLQELVRQLLAETALLAVAAGALGVVLAWWLLDALRVWVLALPFRIPIDLRVLGFTLGLALVTALAFGLAPALRATRTDLSRALKDGSPGSGYRRSRLRGALVVVQVAASLGLIAVAGKSMSEQTYSSRPKVDVPERTALVRVDGGSDSESGPRPKVDVPERTRRGGRRLGQRERTHGRGSTGRPPREAPGLSGGFSGAIGSTSAEIGARGWKLLWPTMQ